MARVGVVDIIPAIAAAVVVAADTMAAAAAVTMPSERAAAAVQHWSRRAGQRLALLAGRLVIALTQIAAQPEVEARAREIQASC